MLRYAAVIGITLAAACDRGSQRSELSSAAADLVTFIDEAVAGAATPTEWRVTDPPGDEKDCGSETETTVLIDYALSAEPSTEPEAEELFADLLGEVTDGGLEDVDPGPGVEVRPDPDFVVFAYPAVGPSDLVVRIGGATDCFRP